jgi:transposase
VPHYPSDISNGEWAVIEPPLPEPAWTQGRGGRPAEHCRDIIDATRYLVKEGVCCRVLPAGFPPWRTVSGYLAAWRASGATERMHH